MNKLFMTLGISGVLALTGCGMGDQAGGNRDVYEESGNTINVNNQRSDIYNKNNRNADGDFGYVRHVKNPIGDHRNSDHFAVLDREKVADTISKWSTDLPNVNEAATLVTDDEVLIAYRTDSKDRNLTADQAKRTALSIVPRYYHVYVSDNANLIKNVESYANLNSTSRDVDNLVANLVKQMLNSPQGYPVNDSENENGVMNNETDHNTTNVRNNNNNMTNTNDNNNQ
jgi:hypothetical protein